MNHPGRAIDRDAAVRDDARMNGDGSAFWTIVAFAFVLGTIGLMAWVLAYWHRNAIERRPPG